MFEPTFPEVVDSSLIATFKACRQLCYKVYFQHWKSKEGASVHLVAGGAFAKGLEVARRAFYEGTYEILDREQVLDLQGAPITDLQTGRIKTKIRTETLTNQIKYDTEVSQALGLQALLTTYGDFQCPPDSPKSAERTAGALEYYFASYPMNQSAGFPIIMPGEKRAIEVSFAHPLAIDHPVTGNPILYVGRSDAIIQYAGDNYICDEKTTTSLGPTWSRQWDMRGQFIGYTWGFRQMGFRVAGVLVRGVSILKTKYDTQESINNYSDFEISRWYTELLEWIDEMKTCWKTGRWRYDLDKSCTDFGGCGFKSVCKVENEQPWLEQYFERRKWDPVTRTETKL